MQPTKQINLPDVKIEDLDLLTPEERKFNDIHIKKLLDFAADGKTTAMELKSLTPGAAVVAKRQQSRSATLMAKLTIMNRYGDVQTSAKTITKDNI